MVKINYPKKFNRYSYYNKISNKRFHVEIKKNGAKTIRREFRNIDDFLSKKTVTLEEVFNKFKELKRDIFILYLKIFHLNVYLLVTLETNLS